MKYTKRQLEQKAKRERELRALVEQSRQPFGVSPAPVSVGAGQKNNQQSKAGASKKAPAVVGTYGKPVKKASSSAPRTAKKAASVQGAVRTSSGGAGKQYGAQQKQSTLTRLRDTISDYRSGPISPSRRRKRTILFYALVLLLISGIVCVCLAFFFFDVMLVKVEGDSNYTEEQIIRVSGIETGDNMFTVDRAGVQKRLTEQLPYIKSVEVTRSYPDTVVLSVTPAVPAANVASPSGYVLIDSESKVLEILDTAKGDLPVIVGADLDFCSCGYPAEYAGDDTAEQVNDLAVAFASSGLAGRVDEVNIEKRHDISFTYGGYITCYIGDMSRIDTKLAMVKVVISDNPDAIQAVIDATDADNVYYRPVAS